MIQGEWPKVPARRLAVMVTKAAIRAFQSLTEYLLPRIARGKALLAGLPGAFAQIRRFMAELAARVMDRFRSTEPESFLQWQRVFNPAAPAVLAGKIRRSLSGRLSALPEQTVAARDRQRVLHRVAGELESLAGGTEGEFLVLGKNLQDVHQRAATISKISSAVAQLMGGDAIADVIGGFRQVTADVQRLERESQRNAATLQNLLESIAGLQSRLSGFGNIIRSLRALGVYTRIESARLGEQDIGFNVLADEVTRLALEIETQYARLLAQSESLSQLLEQTLARVTDLESRRHARASALLDKILGGLEQLMEKRRLSSTGAATIAARYDAISRNMSEIVASMQFHDITRQRIEHAKEALDKIAGKTSNGAEGNAEESCAQQEDVVASPTPLRRCLGFLAKVQRESAVEQQPAWQLDADVCELQMAQLESARDVVVNAVENILVKLAEVADIVTEMSQETQKMAGTADATGSSCFSELETAFASVTSSLAAFDETDQELSAIMDSVGRALEEMASFADAIEGIGERIKRLALNAIVKASHIGEAGQTLGVLAESVHQLSVETRRMTMTVSESLRSMSGESESRCGGAATDKADVSTMVGSISELVDSLLNRVQQINRETADLLARVQEQGSSLSAAILEVLPTVNVHHRFRSVIGDVVAQLGAIVVGSRARQGAAGESGSRERLQALEMAYTMQEERQVHQALMAADNAAQETAPPASAAAGTGTAEPADWDVSCEEETEEDLGDNVELF